MNKVLFRLKPLGRFLILPIFLISAFLLLPNKANAANDVSEYVFFRVDTELDVLNDKGVTVHWTCGAAGNGSVTDNTTSESTQALDGIIKVASKSKEMTDAGCDFKNGSTITASASINGWVTRKWTVALPASSSLAAAFTARASQDYDFVVTGVKNELGTPSLTLNGSSASASYDGSSASASYSGVNKYIAATGNGTLTGGAPGYVNKTVAITFSDFISASQSADFDDSQTSTFNGSQLPFAYKFTTAPYSGAVISGATFTAGDSGGTTCTEGGTTGIYYCPVPLSNSSTTATFAKSGYTTTTTTYALRSTPSDAQISGTIYPSLSSSGGGGGSDTVTFTPTPTPTPGVTESPTPTPTPSISPWPSGSTSMTHSRLFRKSGDPKVYVQDDGGWLHWIKSLQDFTSGGYNWSDVQVVSGNNFANLKIASKLNLKKGIRKLNVRSLPSLKGKIIGGFMPGDQFDKKDSQNGWFEITLPNGQMGWVSSGYVLEQ
jgi:hypothetical protein